MNQSEIIVAVIALISGVLGGAGVTIINHFLSKKKNDWEIRKLQAETEKIRAETKTLVNKLDSLYENFDQQTLVFQREYFSEKPLKITADRKNKFPIPSDFLQWEKCTIIFWANIPPKGKGIRCKDTYRYFISHYTDIVNPEQGWPYYNRFSVGYTPQESWLLGVSSSTSDEKFLWIDDGLDPGWHQFYISWDRSQPIVEIAIDDGEGGKQFSSEMLSAWPDKLAEKVWLGSWATNWEGGYCETELFKTVIYKQYFPLGSNVVKLHASKKPNG